MILFLIGERIVYDPNSEHGLWKCKHITYYSSLPMTVIVKEHWAEFPASSRAVYTMADTPMPNGAPLVAFVKLSTEPELSMTTGSGQVIAAEGRPESVGAMMSAGQRVNTGLSSSGEKKSRKYIEKWTGWLNNFRGCMRSLTWFYVTWDMCDGWCRCFILLFNYECKTFNFKSFQSNILFRAVWL